MAEEYSQVAGGEPTGKVPHDSEPTTYTQAGEVVEEETTTKAVDSDQAENKAVKSSRKK